MSPRAAPTPAYGVVNVTSSVAVPPSVVTFTLPLAGSSVRNEPILRRHHRKNEPDLSPVVFANALTDAYAVHIASKIAVCLRRKMRLGVAYLPRAERAQVTPTLVLDFVQRLG